jgi:hypothetical protein
LKAAEEKPEQFGIKQKGSGSPIPLFDPRPLAADLDAALVAKDQRSSAVDKHYATFREHEPPSFQKPARISTPGLLGGISKRNYRILREWAKAISNLN